MHLDRNAVSSNVLSHFRNFQGPLKPGTPFNGIIYHQGQKLQYTAYKFSDGSYNKGRIHGIK